MTKPILIKDLGTQFSTPTSKKKEGFGIFKCFCGKEFRANKCNVNNGNTKSCGCTKVDRLKTHGLSRSRLYKILDGMKTRCYDKNSEHYVDYGARGIVICDEWLNDFMSFHEWANNNGYSEILTIDRKDNDKGYNPENCRWTNKIIQARNTRVLQKNNTSGYRGVTWNKRRSKFYASITVNRKEIHLGVFSEAIDGAKAYDKYVLDNNLEHNINGV